MWLKGAAKKLGVEPGDGIAAIAVVAATLFIVGMLVAGFVGHFF